MYKDTFKMNNGDIFVDNDLGIVKGQEELRQNIENRLSVNKKEWFLNLPLGLEYSEIQGKGITDKQIEFAIRECCLQDDRVKEVRVNHIIRDSKKRFVDIDITIVDKDDNESYLKEVVELG